MPLFLENQTIENFNLQNNRLETNRDHKNVNYRDFFLKVSTIIMIISINFVLLKIGLQEHLHLS